MLPSTLVPLVDQARTNKAIEIALAEYESLAKEKHVYITGGFSVTAILVLGTAAALAAALRDAAKPQLEIIVVLPLVQAAVLAFALFCATMSNRHGMYLAIVEGRINRLIGANMMRWERRGVTNWPSLRLARQSSESLFTTIPIGLYLMLMFTFIIVESIVGSIHIWGNGYEWVPQWRPLVALLFWLGATQYDLAHLATIVYAVTILAIVLILVIFYFLLDPWTKRLFMAMNEEERVASVTLPD